MPRIFVGRKKRSVKVRIKDVRVKHPAFDRKAKSLPTVFDIDEDNEVAEVIVLDAKGRKELAKIRTEEENAARRRAHAEAIRLNPLHVAGDAPLAAKPPRPPAKPKASVTVTSGKVNPPTAKKGVDLGWVHKKHYLPIPGVEDAVKVSVYLDGKYAENLYLRVLSAPNKAGRINCVVSDEVFWTGQHSIERGTRIQIKQEHIIRLVQNARWQDGKYYESQVQPKKSELETVLNNTPAPGESPEAPEAPEAGGDAESSGPQPETNGEPPEPSVPKTGEELPEPAPSARDSRKRGNPPARSTHAKKAKAPAAKSPPKARNQPRGAKKAPAQKAPSKPKPRAKAADRNVRPGRNPKPVGGHKKNGSAVHA